MKRGLSAIIAVFISVTVMVSCTAGSGRAPEEFLREPGHWHIMLTTESGAYEAELTVVGEGYAQYELLSPKGVAGMIFAYEKGAYSARAGELVLPLDRESFPEKGALLEAILWQGGELLKTVRKEGGEKVLSFTQVGETGNVIYTADRAGRLLRIEREGENAFTAEIIFAEEGR